MDCDTSPEEEDLWTLVYMSASVSLFNAEEIERVLRQARDHNQRDNITGILIYSEGSFVQNLEGPKDKIQATYDRIRIDSRHTRCCKIVHSAIEKRNFDTFSMAFKMFRQGEFDNQVPNFAQMVSENKQPPNLGSNKNSTMLTAAQRKVLIVLRSFVSNQLL
eukprot:TRINITY_DN4431_c0_g2_i1.p1 TRINITY_DN4431_c0_g2~~TRINITY_DN4431_c0_g2_i1.p1  ORF type:complete len:170 (-),score=28.60 TRINITY_DN4431_c0_g2_i1:49-534(-)